MAGVAFEHRIKNLTGDQVCRWCLRGMVDVSETEAGPCPMCEHGLELDRAHWLGGFWRNREPADLPNGPRGPKAPLDVNRAELQKLKQRLWPVAEPAETCQTPPAVNQAVSSREGQEHGGAS